MNNLVSVIIPCYNSATTVGETIDSVLTQTYPNIQIILVNDGSPDNMDEVISSYLKKDNIKYVKQENKGLSGARNSGAKLARGKYFLFLDSDDLIDSTYIEKCVHVFDNQENVKVVYSNGWMFGAVNKKWKFTEYNFRELMMMNTIHASAMMRSEDFIRVGMYDEKLKIYEDWNLWISILKEGGEVVLLPELLFYYRKHEDKSSLTDLREKNQSYERENRQRVYDNHKDTYLKEFGTEIDMLEEICIQYRKIERYKRKASKWYRRLFRF